MSHDSHETAPDDIVPGQARTQGVAVGYVAAGLLVFVALFTLTVLISAAVHGFQ